MLIVDGEQGQDDMDLRVRSDSRILKALQSKAPVDRTEWVHRLKKSNPDIAEVKERVAPLER